MQPMIVEFNRCSTKADLVKLHATDTLFGAIALASAGGTVAATLGALFVVPLLASGLRARRIRWPGRAAGSATLTGVLLLIGCRTERTAGAWALPPLCQACADTMAVSADQAELGGVAALDADSRGRVFIADYGTGTIRVLAPDGTHLRDVGRKGAGPGEFDALMGVRILSGDTLLAFDIGARRLTWFEPDSLALVRTAQLSEGGRVLAWDRGLLLAAGTGSAFEIRTSPPRDQ